ncbi:unnamed protein product [Onchocerca flexuosa]|uniref:Ovule protein n=1 Tax=Onchocerca flexuosa TaxID=387005 RepID=A0A183HYU0_9BILA|nr:unnamed protein product [Onchocerca flexuosa]
MPPCHGPWLECHHAMVHGKIPCHGPWHGILAPGYQKEASREAMPSGNQTLQFYPSVNDGVKSNRFPLFHISNISPVRICDYSHSTLIMLFK